MDDTDRPWKPWHLESRQEADPEWEAWRRDQERLEQERHQAEWQEVVFKRPQPTPEQLKYEEWYEEQRRRVRQERAERAEREREAAARAQEEYRQRTERERQLREQRLQAAEAAQQAWLIEMARRDAAEHATREAEKRQELERDRVRRQAEQAQREQKLRENRAAKEAAEKRAAREEWEAREADRREEQRQKREAQKAHEIEAARRFSEEREATPREVRFHALLTEGRVQESHRRRAAQALDRLLPDDDPVSEWEEVPPVFDLYNYLLGRPSHDHQYGRAARRLKEAS